MRRAALPIALVLCACLLTACATRHKPLDQAHLLPHSSSHSVLIVLLDAAAAGHFSLMGYTRPTTPNLDALATESVVFDHAYAQASGTALSVYSLFTSHYPRMEKVPELEGEPAVLLPPEVTTLAEAMAPRFDFRLIMSANPFVTRELGYDQGATEMIEEWQYDPRAAKGEPPRYAERITPRAAAWFRAHAPGSWFAYLHYIEPHAPYLPPDPYRAKFARGKVDLHWGTMQFLRSLRQRKPPPAIADGLVDLYDAQLAYADAQIGALADSLRACRQWERTIVVVLADHGEGFWQHGTIGHGGVPYEELVHVPLLIRLPGIHELYGKRIEQPVELVDLMPTLLELTGAATDGLKLEGHSLVPLMLDAANHKGRAIEDGPGPVKAVDAHLLHMRSNRTTHPVFALRRGDLKWLMFAGDGRQELYNLRDDPDELHNLLAGGTAAADDAREFPELLRTWLAGGTAGADSAEAVAPERLDPQMIESLRSLGYID